MKQLVPGTPDCRAGPVGDGLIGVDGQNCPFQMYSMSGTFKISRAGSYTFCSTSSDGCPAHSQKIGLYLDFSFFLSPCRSSVFINSTKVVDNDGSVQSNGKRGGSITLAAGLHNMYIEGWAQSAALSMSATYQGPDTSGQELSVQAVTSPQAPASAPPLFPECPSNGKAGDNNFTICGYRASNEIDLSRVDDVQKYYAQVCVF